MHTITLEIPDKLEIDAKEIKRFHAAKLYEDGKLSLGQAAELAGLSKITFVEILGDYNVSLFNYPASEIEEDAARI